MADMFYNSAKKALMDGTIDLDTHVFKICLLTSSYTPVATHTQYSNLTGEVANGNGYTTGGATLANVTFNQTAGTATWDADDPTWAASTFTTRYAVIYDNTATNKDLILLIDFGADKSPNNGPFTVQFNAAGIFTLA